MTYEENIILMSDSYKYSHHLQYPKGLNYMHSYLESRGGTKNQVLLPATKFFGLQYYVKRYLSQTITFDMVKEAKIVLELHGVPFNEEGWLKIVEKHHGKLPLRIRAVREGKVIPRKNLLMTIESTDPEMPWLVGWAETMLMKIWYPTTVATLSYNIYQLIEKFLLETADNLDKLPLMLHDFGYRGATSEESAKLGGLAHLTVFKGTDTVASLVCARTYYNPLNDDKMMPGFSIPASEHSTITSWGQGTANEKLAFRNMIEQFGKENAVFACVSDSWDFRQALESWSELKPLLEEKGGLLVVRPDSGDAQQNILQALTRFEQTFGVTINSKGYKVLKGIALIQGDGVNIDQIYDILKMMQENQYCATNIAFGMGGALLQGNHDQSLNRDTHKFAIKCSAVKIGDNLVDVYKDPINDGGKKSRKGRLDLILNNDQYQTIKLDDEYPIGTYHPDSQLVTYFENGEVLVDFSFSEIVENN